MLKSLFILLLIMLVADVLCMRGLRKLWPGHGLARRRKLINALCLGTGWMFILFAVVWAVWLLHTDMPDYVRYRRFFVLAGLFMVVYVPRIVFSLFVWLEEASHLVFRAIAWLSGWLRMKTLASVGKRSNRVLLASGCITASAVFLMVIHGIFIGRFDFSAVHVEMTFRSLPASFDGYRIAHFSDTHLGSFSRVDAVRKGLDMISDQQADLIAFTGDMINNSADEAAPYVQLFRQLSAPDGKYAVLGNHDIGDYRSWGTIKAKEKDIDAVKRLHHEMGFRLLLDEHIILHRGMDSIRLAGVNNWGLPPFTQHGDLQRASGYGKDGVFTILLSHDPSHWMEEVVPASDIALTLSGHTHGMQMGLVNRWFNWSPVQYKYKQWHGHYREGQQSLYVNRGFGFLSFPGRIGMPPEITVITLRRSK